MEVKTGKGKLKKEQLLWHLTCQGENYAVNNPEDALFAVRGQLLEQATAPLFPSEGNITVSQSNGWVRYILARKYLLGQFWYQVGKDEVLSESELQSLM